MPSSGDTKPQNCSLQAGCPHPAPPEESGPSRLERALDFFADATESVVERSSTNPLWWLVLLPVRLLLFVGQELALVLHSFAPFVSRAALVFAKALPAKIVEYGGRLRDGLKAFVASFKSETPRDDLEFLPASLELVKSPPSPIGRGIVWSLMAFVVIAVVWSCLGKVDVVAVAQGKIIPSGNVKTIQPLERGIVKAIHVSDGQHVERGELLVELDTTLSGADIARIRHELASAELEDARLHGLLTWNYESGLMPTFEPPEGAEPEQVGIIEKYMREEADTLTAALRGLDNEVARATAEARSAMHGKQMYASTLPIVTKRAGAMKQLYEQEVSSEHEWLSLEQERLETLEKMRSEQGRHEEALSAIEVAKEKRAQTISSYKSDLLSKKTETELKIQSLRQELIKAERLVFQQRITAPVAGHVQQLSVHTEGGVVTDAQPLMIIVPDDFTYEIEARVLNKDIGFVREGQEVEIKLEAFPYTEYGIITGQVIHVTDDAIQTETEEGLIYQARCSMDQSFMEVAGKRVDLSPGMQASAEIKIKERRLIQFFLSPLLKYTSESMKER